MIKKLPKQVINTMAAGEVIQRPYNVIKQLVQNAIDAQATQIRVNIRNGGISLIEIVDNGKGIPKADYPLLCQRFATSKISDIDDLKTIQSFGFRGQALASLSYVSDLEISSKFKDQNLGYKCTFKNEKMSQQPEVISMNTGTKIKVNQLFDNLENRRSSLNPGQQKKRIIRLLSHFALHYHYIKFSLESQKGTQITTDFRNYKISQSKMKVFQIITKLPYDKFSYLSKQVLDDMKIEAIITKLNTIKGKALLLNVNNRIAQNSQILKSVQRAYSQCYQSIHEDNETFFIYLSIQLDPKKIDCNQHPSKKTIGFFGGDKIYDNIYNWILDHIKQQSSIKNIATNIISKNKLSFNVNKNILFNNKSQILNNNYQQNDIKPQKDQLYFKTQPIIQDKPIYAFQKSRNDSMQMPINFYFKGNKVQQGQNIKYLKYTLKLQQNNQPKTDNIKKFFQQITYVGCFNLNYIFVQIIDRLYTLNIIPFLQSYIRQWLSNSDNKLIIYEVLNTYERLDLKQIISKFIKNKRLQNKINIKNIIDSILINKDLIYKQYGIMIQQNKIGDNGYIISYPILQKFMSDCIIDQEIAYFLCRIFIKAPNQNQRQSYFIEYLISLFQEKQIIQGIKMQQQDGNGQLSPMNDKYSQYFRDKIIPMLKTKGKDYKQINFASYLSQMMNLKNVYKIFQRC